MIVRGIRIRFACGNGEQYEAIGAFWDAMRAFCPEMMLSGVGFSWEKDTLCYLIGTEAGVPEGTTEKIAEQFPSAERTEIELPDTGWRTYTAAADTLDVLYAEIYKEGPLDYEIERFDAAGNAEIQIWRRKNTGELMEVIRSRRSIRKFEDRAIEPDKLNRVLEAARLCQSAKNRQPWKFLVLTGREKDAVPQIMLRLFEQNHFDIPNYVNSSKSSAQIIQNAPVLVLVFREPDEGWRNMDLLSIGAAVEHICLAAVSEGLGALWIGDTVYTEAEIRTHFGCEELELVCAVALGYPAEAPDMRPRKTMEEICLKG